MAAQTDVFHYYSREIHRADSFIKLLRDVTPRDYLKIGGDGTSDQTLLWMGGNGTIAHPHFDTNNNFYFQIRGHKRFILSAPDQYRALAIHPHLHLCDRQSMLNYTHPDLKQFPLYGTATATVADLSAGDLLYLPPMWFHKVIAKSQSISVNVWSDAFENQIVVPLNTEAVPQFITTTNEQLKLPHRDGTRLLVWFIRHLMKKILDLRSNKERNHFIRENLLKTRFGPFAKCMYGVGAAFAKTNCCHDVMLSC